MLFVISRARRFDGENTVFYFLWYGMGRFWIEGLRTDSLYLFNWTFMGEPVRVSQALSLVMILVSAGVLFWKIRIRRASPEDLMVNRLAAEAAAEAPGGADAPAGEDAVSEEVGEASAAEAAPAEGRPAKTEEN